MAAEGAMSPEGTGVPLVARDLPLKAEAALNQEEAAVATIRAATTEMLPREETMAGTTIISLEATAAAGPLTSQATAPMMTREEDTKAAAEATITTVIEEMTTMVLALTIKEDSRWTLAREVAHRGRAITEVRSSASRRSVI
jgi:hypothetical protein